MTTKTSLPTEFESELDALPNDAPRDAVADLLRIELLRGDRWKLVTKDNPDRLCEIRDNDKLVITPLEQERLDRFELAEDLVCLLQRLGLSKINTSSAPITSWQLITTVGGSRDSIQESYIKAVRALPTRAKIKKQTLDQLAKWSQWEIGARKSFQSKLHARDSLHHLMVSRPQLIQSRYLGDIISDRFFPTTETHRMEKAQEEWQLIRAGRLVLELIRDAQLSDFKAGRGRDFAYLELLSMEGIDLVKIISTLQSQIQKRLGSSQDHEISRILNQWHDQSLEASHENYYSTHRDKMWHSGAMKKGEEDEGKFDLGAQFRAKQMMDRTIRRAGEMEIQELEEILELAQTTPPDDRHAFVAMINRMLDALNLKVQTEDGDLHRLAIKRGASAKGSIQLSGNEAGKTRGFKRVGALKVVPTETTYIGAWMRPSEPGM